MQNLTVALPLTVYFSLLCVRLLLRPCSQRACGPRPAAEDLPPQKRREADVHSEVPRRLRCVLGEKQVEVRNGLWEVGRRSQFMPHLPHFEAPVALSFTGPAEAG